MENLHFRYGGWATVRVIFGVFWILLGISNLVLIFSNPPTHANWIQICLAIILGVMFFTPIVGHNETSFVIGEGKLRIIWRTRIREIVIMDTDIEKIILRNKTIEIHRKGMKEVVLHFGEWLWKLEDKKKVYEFLIEYARQKNLLLEK
jgi:hypothetical protein